jgi:hypothetical protein
MKLEFRTAAFALAVKEALEKRGLSYADACRAAPFIDGRLLSRAVNAHAFSIPSFLAVCAALDLDPLAFVQGRSGETVVEIQPVTAGVSRETRAMAKRAAMNAWERAHG